MQKKQFFESEVTLDEGSRTVVAVINTDSVDRDNEVVLPNGLTRLNYAGNPVVCWGHDYQSLPVGSTQWVKQDGHSLIAKYRISDKTQFARDVWGLLQDGVLRAHSIGFVPLEQSPPTSQELLERPDWKGCRNVVRKWELLEFSLVAIPANPEALAIAVSKGYDPETLKVFGEVQPLAEMWIDEPVKKDIPQPKFARSWKTIEQQLQKVIANLATEEEIFDMLRGRV